MALKKPFSKKKSASPTRPRNALRSAATLILGGWLGLASAAFLALALIDLPGKNQQQLAAVSQALLNDQHALVNSHLKAIERRLQALASDTQWLEDLQQPDASRIALRNAELRRAFPEALSAKLIALGPLGIAAIDPGQLNLRNNIELDLIRRASNGEPITPEAYQHDRQWLFSVAGGIKASDEKFSRGVVLLSFDRSFLTSLLGQIDASQGQTALHQKFGQSSKVIAQTGQAAADEQTQQLSTAIGNWQLSFSHSAELAQQLRFSALGLWLAFAVSAIGGVIASALALRALGQALQHDLSLLGQAKDAIAFSVPGFASSNAKLLDLIKKAPKQGSQETGSSENADSAASTKGEELHSASEPDGAATPPAIAAEIFRAYDIRGLAESQLDDDSVHAIGLAIGSEALAQGQQQLVVAADGRLSSPRIRDALIQGLIDSGRDVINLGEVPTPLMYFATHQLGTQSGVMITGSHNPAPYNGLKVVIAGKALAGREIQALHQRIVEGELSSGRGQLTRQDIQPQYCDYIVNDVAIAQPLKLVIDAGNGITGKVAPQLFEELGCEVIPMYCEVDGNFPNHHPDPTQAKNLTALQAAVREQQADLGIAFDGDGDRVGIVSASGAIVAADRLLMLFAQDVVSRNPGADIIFDVKCTRHLNSLVSSYGGRPIMWKSGHSYMKEKMAETGALLGGEFSGHIFFKERWFGFDDGMYAAARLIEILSTTDPDLDAQLQAFPGSVSTEELQIACDEARKFTLVEQLINQGSFGDGKLSTLDGLRADYADGWGLVRPSNTTPALVLRFEADSQAALSRIQEIFKQQLSSIDNTITFSF